MQCCRNLTKSCFTESCFTEGTVQNTYNCPIIDAFGCYLWKAIVAPEASNRGTPKYGIQNIKSFNSDFASLSLYDLNKSLSHRSLKPGTWCCGLHCVIHSRTRARQTMQKCTPNLYCILTQFANSLFWWQADIAPCFNSYWSCASSQSSQ